MFQTVGHNAIHAIAECMQVPLYQGDLGGIAHQKSLEYNEEESELSDEVEDLKNLLQRVKVCVQICYSIAVLTWRVRRMIFQT